MHKIRKIPLFLATTLFLSLPAQANDQPHNAEVCGFLASSFKSAQKMANLRAREMSTIELSAKSTRLGDTCIIEMQEKINAGLVYKSFKRSRSREQMTDDEFFNKLINASQADKAIDYNGKMIEGALKSVKSHYGNIDLINVIETYQVSFENIPEEHKDKFKPAYDQQIELSNLWARVFK